MELKMEGFKPLTPQDKTIFDPYYDKMNGQWPSSLFFTEMVAWCHSFTIYYKKINQYIVCFAVDSINNRKVFLPFFGHYIQKDINETFAVVEEVAGVLEIPLVIMDVAEWMKPYYEAIPGVNWEVKYDRGLSDYIYQVDDFRKALQAEKIRYNYNYFVRRNQPEKTIITAEGIQECIDFVSNTWCKTHECSECVYGCLKSTLEVMREIDVLDAKGLMIHSKGELIAYCIVSCQKEFGAFHFKKTKRGFQGINEYLHKECLEEFLQEAKLINYAEDMNIDGLREYKSRVAPYTLAPRYELKKL